MTLVDSRDREVDRCGNGVSLSVTHVSKYVCVCVCLCNLAITTKNGVEYDLPCLNNSGLCLGNCFQVFEGDCSKPPTRVWI